MRQRGESRSAVVSIFTIMLSVKSRAKAELVCMPISARFIVPPLPVKLRIKGFECIASDLRGKIRSRSRAASLTVEGFCKKNSPSTEDQSVLGRGARTLKGSVPRNHR